MQDFSRVYHRLVPGVCNAWLVGSMPNEPQILGPWLVGPCVEGFG